MPYYLALESSGAEAGLVVAGLFDIVDAKWQRARFNMRPYETASTATTAA